MITPAFGIFSPTRCGSTALYRALNLIPGTWVASQPFDDIQLRVLQLPPEPGTWAASQPVDDTPWEIAIPKRIQATQRHYTGFKHVWHPPAFLYANPEGPTDEEMAGPAGSWLRLNLALINHPGLRVVFLRRRNEFQRIVSDLIALATGNWGIFELQVSPDEPDLYKQAVSQLPLPPLNEPSLHWYLKMMPPLQERLKRSVVNPIREFWYEDFFGEDVGLSDRIEHFRELVDFLQISAPPAVFASKELALLMRPSAKLNDSSIFDRIPNYHAIRNSLGLPESVPSGGGLDDSKVSPATTGAGAALAHPTALGTSESLEELRKWRLATGADSLATAMVPPELDFIRIVVAPTTTGENLDVRLSQEDVKLSSNCAYVLRFRARATHTCDLRVQVRERKPPWTKLGLDRIFALSPQWSNFAARFVAKAAEDPARLYFEICSHGANTVDVADARLQLDENTANDPSAEPNGEEANEGRNAFRFRVAAALRRLKSFASQTLPGT